MRNGSNLYGFKPLPQLSPVSLPLYHGDLKVHQMGINYKAHIKTEREPLFWQGSEGALRCVEAAKAALDWRDRARKAF